MILAEKQMIRTPIEEMLLREMIDEDSEFICNNDECSDALDDYLDAEPGMFDNKEDFEIDNEDEEIDLFN